MKKIRKDLEKFIKDIKKNNNVVPTNKEMMSRYPDVYNYMKKYKNKTIFLNEHISYDNWRWNKKRNAVQIEKYFRIIKINCKKYSFDSKEDIAKRAGIRTFQMKKIAEKNNIILLPKSLRSITSKIIKNSISNSIRKEEVEKIRKDLLQKFKNKRWTPYIQIYKKFGSLENYVKFLGFEII